MNHATVKIGGHTIPLIGIRQDATEMMCDGCSREFHLSEITLHYSGRLFLCKSCLKARIPELAFRDIFGGWK